MSNQEVDPNLFKPRMPEVDFPPKLEDIFDKARKAAAADTTPTQGKNRHVVVVTPPGGVFRSYDSFSQAAKENANSRVWLGAHFRAACEDGLKQGKHVANYVVHHFLKPLKKHHHHVGDEDPDGEDRD